MSGSIGFHHRWIIRSTVLMAVLMTAGCQEPKRVVTYPDRSLRVRYEPATTYSTCLVASVAMSANYLLDDRTFTETAIRSDLRRMGLDETRVGDLKTYLTQSRPPLHLATLSGSLDDKPPTGLRWWLEHRGFPVICVINRDPVDPAFNHAVVVIGISANVGDASADIIHYLDPSLDEPLRSEPLAAFDVLWGRSGHAMMIVLNTPATG